VLIGLQFAFRRWTGKSPCQVMKDLCARPAQKPVPAKV
jgi:hypothetical protein